MSEEFAGLKIPLATPLQAITRVGRSQCESGRKSPPLRQPRGRKPTPTVVGTRARVPTGGGRPRRPRAPEARQRQRGAGEAQRHEGKKRPAPAQKIDHEAAERGAEQKARVVRGRHEALRPARHLFGHRLGGERPARRLDHRRADPFEEAEEHELEDAVREAAEQRGHGKNREAEAEDLLAPPEIADPAEDDREPDAGELEREQRPRDAEQVGAEVMRHRRHRYVEYSPRRADEKRPQQRGAEEHAVDLRRRAGWGARRRGGENAHCPAAWLRRPSPQNAVMSGARSTGMSRLTAHALVIPAPDP